MSLQARETNGSWSSVRRSYRTSSPLALVEEEGLLDDVVRFTQPFDVRGALAGDDRRDPALAQRSMVGVGAVALVLNQCVGVAAWPVGTACDVREAVGEGEGLGDVANVGRGGNDLERGATSIAAQMVFAACLPALDQLWTGVGSPFFFFFARMWEPSTHAPDRSSLPAALNAASKMRCNWSKPLACCHRSGLRRQVHTVSNPAAPGRAVARLRRRGAHAGYLQTQPVRPRPRDFPARATAAAQSAPTSRRSRSTASRVLTSERSNRHIGHDRPGHLRKIALRALRAEVILRDNAVTLTRKVESVLVRPSR